MTNIVVTNLSDHSSLLCAGSDTNDTLIAHTQVGSGGWTTINPVGLRGLTLDEDEWPGFVALIMAVDEERKRLAECPTAATP